LQRREGKIRVWRNIIERKIITGEGGGYLALDGNLEGRFGGSKNFRVSVLPCVQEKFSVSKKLRPDLDFWMDKNLKNLKAVEEGLEHDAECKSLFMRMTQHQKSNGEILKKDI